MYILLCSIIASLDGFIIGICLKLEKVKFKFWNILLIFFGNIFIYSFSIYLYKWFDFTFITKSFTTFLFLFLSFLAFREKDVCLDKDFNKRLSFVECILLTLTHSLDGVLVSLGFAYQYSIICIVFLFSVMSIIILLLGYLSFCFFTNIKNSPFISGSLFLFLAILNQFF